MKEILTQLQALKEKVDVICKEIESLKSNESIPEVLTNDILIKTLGISRRVAFDWRKTKGLKYYQVGHKVFYLKTDVLEFLVIHKEAV